MNRGLPSGVEVRLPGRWPVLGWPPERTVEDVVASLDQRRLPLVVSGYNPRAVLALLRAFEAAGIEHLLVGRREGDPIDRTRHGRRVTARIGRRLDVGELGAIVARLGGDGVVLVPTTEYLNRWALDRREALAAVGIDLPLGPAAGYLALSDKDAFDRCCRDRDLPVPERHASVVDAPLPFAAKPRHELDADGRQQRAVLVHDEAQRRALVGGDERWFAQRWVVGPSRYLLLHRGHDGEVVVDRQQNGAQQGGGGSVVWAWRVEAWDRGLEHRVAALLDDVGHLGPAMFEVRGGDADGVLIECNPRPWGPLQLVVDHGSPVVGAWLASLVGRSVDVPQGRAGAYTWLGGAVQAVRDGRGLAWFDAERPRRRLLGDLRDDVLFRSDSWREALRELRPRRP